METEELSSVLCDVRKAQRLLVAFHQRVIPIIHEISERLYELTDGIYFYRWTTEEVAEAPPTVNTYPLDLDTWRFSPLVNPCFLFLEDSVANTGVADPNDIMICIRLVSDTVVREHLNTPEEDCDPLSFEPAEEASSILDLYAYQTLSHIEERNIWYSLWADNDYPDCTGEPISIRNGEARVLGLRRDLSSLVDTDAVHQFADEFNNHLVKGLLS